jgi:hypothetical protein
LLNVAASVAHQGCNTTVIVDKLGKLDDGGVVTVSSCGSGVSRVWDGASNTAWMTARMSVHVKCPRPTCGALCIR